MQVNFEISHQNTPQFNVEQSTSKDNKTFYNPQDTDARLIEAERYDSSPIPLEVRKVCVLNSSLLIEGKETKSWY